MTASMYTLIILAFVLANLPFLLPQFLGVIKTQKHFGHHLIELALGFFLTGVLAYVLESRAGAVQHQDWEFYAVTICMYLILAFPAFVWRYFWQGKHQQ